MKQKKKINVNMNGYTFTIHPNSIENRIVWTQQNSKIHGDICIAEFIKLCNLCFIDMGNTAFDFTDLKGRSIHDRMDDDYESWTVYTVGKKYNVFYLNGMDDIETCDYSIAEYSKDDNVIKYISSDGSEEIL